MAKDKQLYLVNLLNHNLSCISMEKGEKINIKLGPGEYKAISEAQSNNELVVHAVSNDWAKIVDKEPTSQSEASDGPEITITKPYEGISEAQLKEERAKEVKAPKKPVATGSAIGQGEAAAAA